MGSLWFGYISFVKECENVQEFVDFVGPKDFKKLRSFSFHLLYLVLARRFRINKFEPSNNFFMSIKCK